MSDGNTGYVGAIRGRSRLPQISDARRTFTAKQLGLDLVASISQKLEKVHRDILNIQLTCSDNGLKLNLEPLLRRNETKALCTAEEYVDIRFLAHAIWRETVDSRSPKQINELVNEAIPEPEECSVPMFRKKAVNFALGEVRLQLTTLFTGLIGIYREVGDEGMCLRLAEDEEESAAPDERTNPTCHPALELDFELIRQKIYAADPKTTIQKEKVYHVLKDGQEITFNLANFGIVGWLNISRYGETISITGQMIEANSDIWQYETQQFRDGACLLLGRAEIAQLLSCMQSTEISRRQMAITMEGDILVISDIGQGPLQTTG